MKDILKLIRPHQWIKNGFVLLPLFFGGALLNVGSIVAALITTLAFSLVASSIYCFNDVIDVEADRRHPVKCKRPVASGAIKESTAYIICILLPILANLILCFPFGIASLQDFAIDNYWEVSCVLSLYWMLNICYCTKLKQYAIIDVCIIAFGFILRILAGGLATNIALSKWIVLMTFLLTLFLSFAKRRDDVLRMNETGEAPRKNTIHYNLTFINQAITITASMTFVCYIMYTVSPDVMAGFGTENLYLTSIFVLIGLLRYIQITVVENDSGDPTKVIIRDRFTQIIVLLWGLTFMFLIYKRNILG